MPKHTLQQASLLHAVTFAFPGLAKQLRAGDGLVCSCLCLLTHLRFSWVGKSSVARPSMHPPSRGRAVQKSSRGRMQLEPAAQYKTWPPLWPLLLRICETSSSCIQWYSSASVGHWSAAWTFCGSFPAGVVESLSPYPFFLPEHRACGAAIQVHAMSLATGLLERG